MHCNCFILRYTPNMFDMQSKVFIWELERITGIKRGENAMFLHSKLKKEIF